MSQIECQDVCFAYEEETNLSNVNLSINRGDFIGIIGPNGGGKTTLLKLLMGFLRPTRGTIHLFGEKPEKMRHKMGYVPQRMQFDRSFPISVKELILSPFAAQSKWFGTYPNELEKKAERLMNQFKLSNGSFGDLSGGMMQRALIARALIDEPDILLFDEPTSNIDPHAREDIYQIIYDLKGKKTILLVTHDLNHVIENVDRIYTVEKEVTTLKPQEVCEHFAVGLYHPPLKKHDG